MALDSGKGYRALRNGRRSQSGAEYFVTFCTDGRQNGLTSSEIAQSIFSEIHKMEAETVWFLRCGVIMPDHVHLLVWLGDKLSLGKAIARLKSKSTIQLKNQGLRWQSGYFDHYMRSTANPLPVFLYIYLNPYKADLIPTNTVWPWFACGETDQAWFLGYLDRGLPGPAWLTSLP